MNNTKSITSSILLILNFFLYGCSENNQNSEVEKTFYSFKNKSIDGDYSVINYTDLNKTIFLKDMSNCIISKNEDKFYKIKNDIIGDEEILKNDIITSDNILGEEIQNNLKNSKTNEKFLTILETEKGLLKGKISDNYFNIRFNDWTKKSNNIIEYKQNMDFYIIEKTILNDLFNKDLKRCVQTFFHTPDFIIKEIIISKKNTDLAKLSLDYINESNISNNKRLIMKKENNNWILLLQNKENK